MHARPLQICQQEFYLSEELYVNLVMHLEAFREDLRLHASLTVVVTQRFSIRTSTSNGYFTLRLR